MDKVIDLVVKMVVGTFIVISIIPLMVGLENSFCSDDPSSYSCQNMKKSNQGIYTTLSILQSFDDMPLIIFGVVIAIIVAAFLYIRNRESPE